MYAVDVPADQIFYHGTKADLKPGDLLAPGFGSNFAERALKHIYFSATLEAATWGAELAQGDAPGQISIVEPTGKFEDDPNLTRQEIPRVRPRSYRSSEPLACSGRSRTGKATRRSNSRKCATTFAQLKEEGAAIID